MQDGWGKSPQAMKATLTATRAAAKVSTGVAGLFAARLWFTPWTVPLGERAKAHQAAWLEGSRQVEFSTPAGRLAGFATGAGPTILLVHGWGERAGDMGAFIEPLVRNGFGVVGIDLPAHGRSPGTQTNLIAAADGIADVARQVNARGAVAHSMGAHAVMTAMTRGFAPDAVVLLAPAVRLSGALKRFGFLFGLPPRAVTGLRSTIERRFGETVWEDFAADRMATSFTTPALIVHDRDDPQIDPADSELLAGAWPGAVFAKTTGLGHGRIVRDASVVLRGVQFMRTHLPPERTPESRTGDLAEAGSR